MTFRAWILYTAVCVSIWVGLFAMHAGTAVASPPSACDVPSVVARALPAIVNITVVKVLNSNSEEAAAAGTAGRPGAMSAIAGASASDPSGPHFETFVGSGVIINPAGVILTNKHVIKDAAVIEVMFSNDTQVPAQLIAAGSLIDLAVLKVDIPKPLPALQFDDSDKLQVGQTVVAVGNPLGLGTSVSVGIISARGRDLLQSPFGDYIQTDATINPGNSGGPMLDCAGKVVGIDTALLSNSTTLGSIGIGFALPSDLTQFVVRRLLYPKADPPNWIGVTLQTLTPRLATIFGHLDMHGAIVTEVRPGSPAASAGIEPGDIIDGANGRALDSATSIMGYIVDQPLSRRTSLLVWHHGQMEDSVVRGEAWPNIKALRSDVLASPASVAQAQAEGIGLHLVPMTPAAHGHDGSANVSGVLVDGVTPGSQAAAVGVEPGNIIERVDEQAATTPAQVMAHLARGSHADGDLVALLVRGKAGTRWITLYLGTVHIAGLIAAPLLPGGFGAADDVEAPGP
jgi:serine protease Do